MPGKINPALPAIIFFSLICSGLAAQQDSASGAGRPSSRHRFVLPKKAEVNYSEIKTDFAPSLIIREMPRQGARKVEHYPAGEQGKNQQRQKSGATLPSLTLGTSFLANSFGVSTPNDNDLAISDSGFVVSVINTNIFMRNTATQTNYPVKSLAAFTQPINNFHEEFDPKVMYDPDADRFVLVCMVGFVDSTSKIVVAFSKSGDPSQGWNLYELPGDPLGNNLWSDFPMIALSKKELFLTVNLLYNDSSWQTGFVETVVWQIAKDSGYAGGTLVSDLHNNFKFNDKPLRNLCPVKGGSRLYGPPMYFLSNRNFASQNDSVFLVRMNGTLGSPTTVGIKALKSNLPYRFPPEASQKATTDVLATNDARVLGAFYENDKIQYVQNTRHPDNQKATVQYGVIHGPEGTLPPVTNFLLENGNFDYGYANISYAGLDSTDHTAIITFNHSSPLVYPGCSAIQADGYGTFSPILKIKDGIAPVNVLVSTIERWGDYSGSQRRYNKPGEVWMSGYYGYPYGTNFPNAHAAWVAQITTQAGLEVGVNNIASAPESVNVYPNPARDIITLDLSLGHTEYVAFEVADMSGKKILLLRDWVKAGDNLFSFSARDLAPGSYVLMVTGNRGTAISKKFIVE